MIQASKKIQSFQGYAFDEMDKLVAKLRAERIDVIDFGSGDPRDETPEFVRETAKRAIDTHKTSGYPSYVGMPEFREAVAAWYKRRFGVTLDPQTEITSTIGSKEGIFNFPEAFLNPGDFIIMPTPGYPPYARGTLFAEGKVFQYPLLQENNFFPDFSRIPEGVAKQAKIFWLCYPNNPTGKCATRELFEQALQFCQRYGILLASDECYIDLFYKEKALSALEISKKGVVAFHSLSKRNNMTGYRVGFVCGDPDAIGIFKKLKTNIDSGTPNFIQAAAIAALNDEQHVAMMREKYRKRSKMMVEAMKAVGLDAFESEGTFYLWQRVPKEYDGVSFAKRLLEKDCAIAVTPGAWISDITEDGVNPGQNYVRFALIASDEQVEEAAARICTLHL